MKVKVAGYCRVSTDQEDQANSFLSQQHYFREYIHRQPDWELYNIYADEGLSGTSTKKRTQFNRMIMDAYEGKFQMILTKEVSRFSRNILDTIAYTRELRAIGVGVFFVTDRINTMDPEAEMLLSFLASLAQEESRRTSSRVTWGQTRQMERGVVFGHSLLGYDVKNGCISINPEGAELVRMIFRKYAVEQSTTSQIAGFLTKEGYRTFRGNSQWKSGSIVKILKNEKYIGDLVQKKTYTPDFLTHEKHKNSGQVPLITIENHHTPIISRELWNMAQQRLKQNNKHGVVDSGHSNRYCFSGKIRCGECGSTFVGRFKYRKNGEKVRRWSCSKATSQGTSSCDVGRLIRDDDAMQMLQTAIRSLPVDKKSIIKHVTALALEAIQKSEARNGGNLNQLRIETEQVQKKKEAVMDSYFSQEISKEDMQAMNRKYDQQLKVLCQKRKSVERVRQENADVNTLRTAIVSEVAAILSGEVKSEVFCKTMVDRMTVYKNRNIELRLHFLPQIFWFK